MAKRASKPKATKATTDAMPTVPDQSAAVLSDQPATPKPKPARRKKVSPEPDVSPAPETAKPDSLAVPDLISEPELIEQPRPHSDDFTHSQILRLP